MIKPTKNVKQTNNYCSSLTKGNKQSGNEILFSFLYPSFLKQCLVWFHFEFLINIRKITQTTHKKNGENTLIPPV